MVSADPPNNTARSKKLILNSTRPAGPAPQIPNQPRQANTLDLRYTSANQAPAKSSKCYRPATGGGGAVTSCTRIPVRKAMVMRPSSRPWSRAHFQGHAHGHGHTFTGMRKPARRDQRTAHTNQAPTQLTQTSCGCVTHPRIYNPTATQNAWGAWASTATAASMSTTGGAAAACAIGPKGPIVVGPDGPTIWPT